MQEKIREELGESIKVKEKLSPEDIAAAADLITEAFNSGGKILLCGNGGSAADCQHIAGEFIGRFKKERDALPAISLSTDTSILTALANDYGGDIIFSRQVEALGREGDVLVAFSTSGTSPNIIKAAEAARDRKMKVIGFTGANGEKLKKLSDVCIMAGSKDTPRIQEAHITAAHIICGLVEANLF
ncbi:MAG: D-sedoheptulose 7-phosphate isomerase [Candidatus Altiarchaeales archaeon]|nr:D-sedoheptulose 7-phosphate isomerase [Candidatus Altiarchaeales archaeon]MBD3415656.1 D-sedoheptulose 7-phosphate isomerase [Candidatus Altiarchaeales archaeon]